MTTTQTTATANPYPLTLRTTGPFVSELHSCEYGRYEDATTARESNDTDAIKANGYELVLCDFVPDHGARITVSSDAQLRELYYALASGTIGLTFPDAANRMLDKIRDRVRVIDPKLVAQWPFQNGM